jgi:uncharacterized protein YqeY
MVLRNPFARTPGQWGNWTEQRQQQWIKNRREWNKLSNQYNKALTNQNTPKVEKLRGQAQAIRLNEQQQRADYRQGVVSSRLEQRQMGLQQQFIAQIGELSATQNQQFKTLQEYLVSQMRNQQTQLQQQASFFEELRAEQQRLAAVEAARAEEEKAMANRDAGLLAHQSSQAGLFNLRSELRSTARQTASRRTVGTANRRVFSV